MKHSLALGDGWDIIPAGGSTGEAYIALHEEKKLFLKRNSSPFLAVLSAEGIVPKLLWTKRMGNGDVITAQHWLEGRELKPFEMYQSQVAKLLSKIHHSAELLDMLKRMNVKTLYPISFIQEIEDLLDTIDYNEPIMSEALNILKQEEDKIVCCQYVVCHGDVNHNNWLLSEENQLYLIDWDGAKIADPALDIGLLLHSYIKKNDWEQWLSHYGIRLTKEFEERMKWYAIAQTMHTAIWHIKRNQQKDANNLTDKLTHLLLK